ncbi:hypothetical protein PILCRDRAFT_406 [Piloderma croceum F 1598]|uniref:Uncharacterized protein n=1 Tax=Piloderma croceum (strain F 1598) TaxID=765440 RepID=A0A0C3CRQ7_PILCF|nr:hypothetical protein PILCRDRAFT_406 [Piloderma croceum F 1598]
MGSTYIKRLEDTQRDLASYFYKSAAIVRSNFDWFEKQVGRPAIAYSLASFDAHPFTTTFLAIFYIVSCLPIIAFLAFSLFVIASITFGVCALTFITIVLVESILLTILLGTLAFLLIFSFTLTPLALFGYLTFRFIVHVRNGGRTGASQWATETKEHFVTSSRKVKPEIIEGSDVSSGSVVIVDAKEQHSTRNESAKVQGD